MYEPTEQLIRPIPEPGMGPPHAPTGEADSRDALPPGTRIAEFEIMCVLGTGGFGIVYLALDHALMRQVAIKEYMPGALAQRGLGDWVALRSSGHAETFSVGLKSFINEAQLLAGFDHPSLLKVHRFWEANGTAYMVMQYYAGRTLKDERLAMTRAPDEPWMRRFIEPLLSALEVLHGEGVYHRDISPDNILLQPDGRPVLLDFGAARRVIGDRTQTLTAILKPNFAPVEQYADIADMRQGPWTDLYAIGAVVHYMVTGQAPTPAVARAVRDGLKPLGAAASVAIAGISPTFLRAVDWALAVAPTDRPQNVQQFRDALNGKLLPPLSPAEKRAQKTARRAQRQSNRLRGAAAAAGLVLVAVMAWAYHRSGDNDARAIASLPVVVKKAPHDQSGRAAPYLAREPVAPSVNDPTTEARITGASTSPSSPDDACRGRNFFSKALCVNRQCESSRFSQHPQCVRLRQDNEARARERNSHN